MSEYSLLRYAGGKSRSIGLIREHLPFSLKELCSPFFGGGSIEHYCASQGTKVYAYDVFHSLVSFWDAVKNYPSFLADTIEAFYPLSKDSFYLLQKELIEMETKGTESASLQAALFFVLNRASFSGTTLSGGMSPGHPRFTKKSIDKIRNFPMENVSIECLSFEDSIPKHPNTFLYCDPPYFLDKGKNVLYGINGSLHSSFDHEKLFSLLSARNKWLLSYNDCEWVRNRYKDFNIVDVQWAYGMNKNKKSSEILIKSKE